MPGRIQGDIALVEEKKVSLRQKTIMGIGWTTVAQIGKQVLQFIISTILARLLTPQDFGLVGIIVVFTGFAKLFGELGFSAALIQRENLEERHYSSIFWLNLMAGLILTGLIMYIAPFVATFYNEPRLAPLAMLIAVNLLINSLNMVQNAILNRVMDFRWLALIEIATVIVAGVVAIVLAMTGYGVWSLAWQMLAASSITAVGLWCVTDWRPHLLFNLSAVAELLGFSANLLGFNVFNYWVRQGDNLLVGKFIGTAALGIYTRAYSIMSLPVSQVTGVLSRVMFPALSRVQNDKACVKRIYLRALGLIALITFPLMMGLMVVADHFVLALFGSKWSAVIPLLWIFSLSGMVQSISGTVGWIYTSQGRTDWMFKWVLGAGTLLIGSFIVGIWIGKVEAVAASYAFSESVVLLYPAFAIPGRLIGMTFSEVIRSVAGIFGCASGMAVVVWTLGLLLPSNCPHWGYLAIQVPFGAFVYLAILHLFRVRAYREVKALLIEQWHIRQTAKVRTKA